ncbi:outer membrane receptor protein involved in Fe transport [Filimonas zeae]|uniref:TonB-dependent receptor n=1 Tax=Filimonas zeae TaxID=1737353 RepID=A0A917IYY2_9BACT|nr:outer membrane beta-barrel family protein [Filimonas zeae]MDR6340155.1 outer membrane receptor protein involved in Fe transport [Filimonas zeae]GGH71409.1 TonB-dependent receptor [Filimonas zeae]
MKKRLLQVLFAIACFYSTANAQRPAGAGGRGGQNMNAGHLYGKIVDSKTNKGVDGATVQLIAPKFDTVTRKMKDAIAGTVLTQNNGDFSLESLPVFGKFTLRVSALGYTDYNAPVSFDLKMPNRGADGAAGSGGGEGGGADRMQQMLSMVDKDLGNIKLTAAEANLGNVTVTATSKQFFEMGVDRKIFNVDKNLVSSGQTATEVMKQIPSVNVDIDGNVTLRNSSPQLFVDGRPTTLTLDQIPSDIIDKVELITNPSAKYDASSGGGGILNIVLKKNKKSGYNGGLRAGVDSRGKFNGGGDINYRQGKINFTLNGMYNQRRSKTTAYTDRLNISDDPTFVTQETKGVSDSRFMFIRPGLDFFIDNRNTLSINANFVNGKFSNDQPSRIDSLRNNAGFAYSDVTSTSTSSFNNPGGQISFKHNFAKSGHSISADANYNSGTSKNTSNLSTATTNATLGKLTPVTQRTESNGYNRFWTFQTDYENPLTENTKLEAGVRAAIRNYWNDNNQLRYDYTTREYILNPIASNEYKFNDQVYAAYATYSFKAGTQWNYQLGLRAESSNYTGTLMDKDTSFNVKFPLSLFPTAFVTYKLNDKQDIQFNYTRKVNRPSFFQLTPVVDYSDPQNLSVGNANMKPEFTNSLEVNYNNAYKRNANFLVSGYFRYATNLITSYQYRDINQQTGDSAVYNTYVNANNSITYGLELTNRITIAKIWDMSLNLNVYNSKINNDNLKDAAASNQRVSWFTKMNNNFKLPKNFSIQFSGDYQAKTVLPPGGGGGGGGRRGGGGGGGWNQGPSGTSQGYIKPRYSFDLAIRKDWTWKGGNSASVTLSMNDIFRTQLYSSYNESAFMIQNSERRRDPQILRLNLSYRFGKFDATLFKRKNNKAEQGGGMDMMGGGS